MVIFGCECRWNWFDKSNGNATHNASHLSHWLAVASLKSRMAFISYEIYPVHGILPRKTRLMSTSIKHSTNNKIGSLCCLAPVVVFDDTSICWQEPYAVRSFHVDMCILLTTPIQYYTLLDKLNNKFTLSERNNLTLYALILVLNLWCDLSNWAETFRIYFKYIGAIEQQSYNRKRAITDTSLWPIVISAWAGNSFRHLNRGIWNCSRKFAQFTQNQHFSAQWRHSVQFSVLSCHYATHAFCTWLCRKMSGQNVIQYLLL